MGRSLGAEIWDVALLALIEGTQRSGGHGRGQPLPSDPCPGELERFRGQPLPSDPRPGELERFLSLQPASFAEKPDFANMFS